MKTPIREDQAILDAKEIIEEYDTESSHSKLDDLLCDVLDSLGYEALVKVYKDADKWYS